MSTATEITPNAPPPEARGWFGLGFVAVVIVANLAAVGLAWQDKSWGALWIAFMGGPMLNGVLALSGLATIPFLRRRRSSFSLAGHLALTLGVPGLAVVVDFFAILMMDLRGH